MKLTIINYGSGNLHSVHKAFQKANSELQSPFSIEVTNDPKQILNADKAYFDLSDEEIISVNIPTGVPLVYEFDDNFNVIHKEYLIDQAKLEEKQAIVVNQGKAQ